MSGIIVEIIRVVDSSFPGFVECRLKDAFGDLHQFVEKVPVVTSADLDAQGKLPQLGVIACTVEKQWDDGSGNKLVTVSTEKPWDIESADGKSKFTIFAFQLADVS